MGVAVFSGMIGVTAFGTLMFTCCCARWPVTQHGAAPMEHIGASRIA
jgi:hypothetical protein